MLLAAMLVMIWYIRQIDELYTRSRMCDIDQPCRWSGDSSISPDIGYESGNSRTVSLVGWRRFDEVENDRQELASLEGVDSTRAHIAVPPPFGQGGADFARLGRIWCNDPNPWMMGVH